MGVKKNTLRGSGHRERIKSKKIVKEVYFSESESSNLSGRPLGRWRDKVKEYMCEGDKVRRGGLVVKVTVMLIKKGRKREKKGKKFVAT